MANITGLHVGFKYNNGHTVLDNLLFEIEPGKMTAILGKNGCGKSTLIKLITALLPLSTGRISINGLDIKTEIGISYVRQHCGIIFQNPDNQFVSPILEDDIAFGLTNHHVPETEQKERIQSALKTTGLAGLEKRSIASFSGGQKQRAAAAGILAINSDILIFDEATSMLDPEGKKELLGCIEDLRSQNKTIILITQNIEDVLHADSIFLLGDHRILASGTPREILTDHDLLYRSGVQIPFPVRVFHDLLQKGVMLKHCPLTIDELAEELCCLI